MRFRIWRVCLILSVALLLLGTGCDTASTRLDVEPIQVASNARTVDLVEQFDDETWDRLYVFPPYTTRDRVESRLGFGWPEFDDTTVEMSDSVCLLVFVGQGQVVGWYEQPRNVDLSELDQPDGYSREDCVFEVVRTSDGVALRY